MSDPKYFTLVFEGDLRSFKGNPFKTETPYGIPVSAGIGDAFDEVEKLIEQLDKASPAPPRMRSKGEL